MKSIYLFSMFAAVVFTGCVSIESKLNRLNPDVSSLLEKKQWENAERFVMENPKDTKPNERYAVNDWRERKKADILKGISMEIKNLANAGHWRQAEDLTNIQFKDYYASLNNWRAREQRALRHRFANSLQIYAISAYELYQNGNESKGNEIRAEMEQKYNGSDNADEIVSKVLEPCLKLVMAQMDSLNAIATMKNGFQNLIGQVEEINVNDGKDALMKLNEISTEFKKYEKLSSITYTFMNMLKKEDNAGWAPINSKTYSDTFIRPMELVKKEVVEKYRLKRWYVRVIDRRADYAEVEKLLRSGDLNEAYQILKKHEPLLPPEELKNANVFDDQSEREKVLSGPLGESIVKGIFDNKTSSGVRGVRRIMPGNSIYSLLAVGRVEVENLQNRANLRNAQRQAMTQARAAFVQFMETQVSSKTKHSTSMIDDEASEKFESKTVLSSDATIQGLILVATGLCTNDDTNEVVVIMGWRIPEAGNIIPAPMHKHSDNQDFSVSPSAGAFL